MAIPNEKVKTEAADNFYYAVYTKYNPTDGLYYVGRTSGYGSPEKAVRERDYNHHMTGKGYTGKAELRFYLPATIAGGYQMRGLDPSYMAIRAAEQFLINTYRDLKMSGNYDMNSLSPTNKRRESYIEALQRQME